MSDQTLRCPRRDEAPFSLPGDDGKDSWREDGTCSYCGSLNPDMVMSRIEAGTVELGPTDKNYKAYVENAGGEPIKVHGASKFYFQHLSEDQRKHFVQLLNEKKIKIGVPGYFYSLPFFIKRG